MNNLKKPTDRPVKELNEYSYDELVELLGKQQRLLSDGIAARLPDKGAKIRITIEKIKRLLDDPQSQVNSLEAHFNSLSIKKEKALAPPIPKGLDIKPPQQKPKTEPQQTQTQQPQPAQAQGTTTTQPEKSLVNTNNPTEPEISFVGLSPDIPLTARPIIKKLFDVTESPARNLQRKEHLDLFVRGRRGANLDTKEGFKGVVVLGLEEAIRLRDERRAHKKDRTGLVLGDEHERNTKYEIRQQGDGEEDMEDEDPGVDMEEISEEEAEGMMMGGKKPEGKKQGALERKPSKGKQIKEQQQQQPVWDVQEDIKDILDMIPQEYKAPQKR